MREHSLFRYPNNLKTYKPKTYEKNNFNIKIYEAIKFILPLPTSVSTSR